MSESARLIPLPVREPVPQSRKKPTATSQAWLGWLVAACLAALAFNAHRQLQIQRRLLNGSQELEQLVARSRVVSIETNRQLTSVQELDEATSAMDGKLARVALTNAAIRTRLDDLDRTVASIQEAVGAMNGQVGRSRELLGQIAAETAALHATLQSSRRVGAEVGGHLAELVRAQEAINADLAELTAKTRALDRFAGGR